MSLDATLPDPIRALPTLSGGAWVDSTGIDAHHLVTPNCEILFVTGPAGAVCEPHSHDTENATVIVSGQVTVTTADGEQRCGPGDWYQSHPGQEHAIRFDADSLQIELRFTNQDS